MVLTTQIGDLTSGILETLASYCIAVAIATFIISKSILKIRNFFEGK